MPVLKDISKLIATISFVLLPALLLAGEGKITPSKANSLYQRQNYEEALEYYKYLVKADERNITFNFRLGMCYLNTNINKALAIPYFKTVIELDALDGKTEQPDAMFYLGKALHYDLRFAEARETFEKYLEQGGHSEQNVEMAKQSIQFCFNAEELIKFPVDISFENLGKEINSEYPDYYPHIPADESFIIFNSKRPENSSKLFNGSYASNVYYSEVKNGKYKKAKLLDGKVNTKHYNEAIIGMTADGKEGIFYIDNEDDMIDLFHADIVDFEAINIEVLNPKYHSNDLEIAASVSADGNTMYIASKRKGGFGGSDIYMAKKLPTGHWGELMNLGPEINTPYDDVFPNISPDERTLYFSSEGHTSMGGLDIFKAEWDPKQRKWTAIKNMGYPLNTPEDNLNFRISNTGKYGYMSALRQGGYGDLDIYRVDFNSIDPRYTIITGRLYAVNTNQLFEDIMIEVSSMDNGELYGRYLPNSITGKYVIILPPGEYSIYVEVEGFKEVHHDVEVLDKSDFQTYIEKDLVLKPKGILDRLPVLQDSE